MSVNEIISAYITTELECQWPAVWHDNLRPSLHFILSPKDLSLVPVTDSYT